MAYEKTVWQGEPSTATPLSPALLQKIEDQLEANDLSNPTSSASVSQNATIATPGGSVFENLKTRFQTGAANALAGVATALREAISSFGVSATGDSTTTADWAWFRLFADGVAADFPAFHHRYWKWNDTTQDFDPRIILTPEGTPRALVMGPGTTTQRGGVSHAGTNITGDIDLRMNLTMASWTPTETSLYALIGKWGDITARSCQFWLKNDGTMRFQWATTDGTTFSKSGDSTAAVPFTAGSRGWVRVTLDVDNGAGGYNLKFWTSTDGATWTQLGTTITATGITQIWGANDNSNWAIGSANGGSSLPSGTLIHEVQIRRGISGAILLPILPELWDNGVGTYQPFIQGTPIIDWIMGGQPGGGIGYAYAPGYLTTGDRPRMMTPNVGQLAMFFNSSHNEYELRDSLWVKNYTGWVENCSAEKPQAARIMLTQNPRTGTSHDNGKDWGHRYRRSAMLALAHRGVGLDVIDTYQAFYDDGRDLSVLIGDGTHPTGDGYAVWAARIRAELDAALIWASGNPLP